MNETRNYRAEATEFESPSAQQLIASVLSLVNEDMRAAAALDIETAIRLRIGAAQVETAAETKDAARYKFLTKPHNDWHVARWIATPRGSGTWKSIHGTELTNAIDAEINA